MAAGDGFSVDQHKDDLNILGNNTPFVDQIEILIINQWSCDEQVIKPQSAGHSS